MTEDEGTDSVVRANVDGGELSVANEDPRVDHIDRFLEIEKEKVEVARVEAEQAREGFRLADKADERQYDNSGT